MADQPTKRTALATVSIPAPSNMLVINLLGVIGLLCANLAIGGLTHNWWWAVLTGGVSVLVLSVIAMTHEAATAAKRAADTGDAAAAETATAPTPLPQAA